MTALRRWNWRPITSSVGRPLIVGEKYRPFVGSHLTELRVTVGGRDLEATWTDDAPETRGALEDALPVSGRATRWGDELYFDVPIDVPAENVREVVAEGAIAYWPAGNVRCLFWGSTPTSGARSEQSEDLGTASGDERNREPDEPRAASPVNVVAQVGAVGPLEDLEGGTRVRLERSSEYVDALETNGFVTVEVLMAVADEFTQLFQ